MGLAGTVAAMGAVAWGWLGLAAVAAVGDWAAVATGNRRLEYVCKPATMVALIGVAATIQPAVAAQRLWWLLALALCLCGDVFLMLPRDRFVAGLGAFLLGHLAYIAGFNAAGVPPVAAVLLLPLLVVMAVLMPPVIHGVLKTGKGAMVAPILIYALAISVMAASSTREWVPGGGGRRPSLRGLRRADRLPQVRG